MFYGAIHQKPARFQVITNKRIKHPLKFGDVVIELAECFVEVKQIQRLGFILEKIDRLLEYLENSDRPFVTLVPYISKTGHPGVNDRKLLKIPTLKAIYDTRDFHPRMANARPN